MKSKSYFLSVLFILSACNIQTADTVQERGIVPLLSNDTSTIQHYQALVIGNNQYDYSPLQNPVNDATDMARVLSEMGFEVTLKTNVKQKAMDKAINTFGRHLSENKGVGLFYFAGHGARVSGENYLLPINNNSIQTEDDLKYHAVAARKILKKMEDATLNIMILDACRNNPYQGTTRSLQQGLSRLDHANNSSGSIIAFATAPETQAFDSSLNGRNGLYTSHILKSLKNAYETHQRIDDMFMGVRNAVELESSGKQIPWYSASLRTPFCFGGCQNSVSSEQAQLETFAHRMGINIKEIATDQMPAWLNDDNSDIMGYGVVTNSRILEDRVLSWEESVLRSITLALGVITRQLKVNLDSMFMKYIPSNDTELDKISKSTNDVFSRLFFKSEPNFSVNYIIQQYVKSTGIGDNETLDQMRKQIISFQQPIFVHNKGRINYVGEEENHTSSIIWSKHSDISAKQLASLIKFMTTLGINVTDFSYSAGKNPTVWCRITLDMEKAKAKGLGKF